MNSPVRERSGSTIAPLQRVVDIYRTKGPLKFTLVLLDRSLLFLWSAFLFYPVYIVLFLLRPIKLIRFGPINADRIGSLAATPGYYTCERKHGIAHSNTFDIFYYHGHVCNQQLLKMWKRVLHVSFIANYFSRVLFRKPYGDAHKIRTNPYDKFGLRDKTEPFIGFTEKEDLQARREMEQFIPDPTRPFICLLSRDDSYLKGFNPAKDWTYHDYRNCKIANYLKCAETLASMGRTFIRLGSMVSEPFPSADPNVIDYAYENHRTELLDVYLTAKCRFFISCGTGLDTLANLFHRPVLYVNFIPYTNFCLFADTITVPKLLRSTRKGRLLTFKEIYSSDVYGFLQSDLYAKEEIEIIENDDDEINDAALEMEMRLNGSWTPDPADEDLQKRFWAIYRMDENRHGGDIRSRIGASFLRKFRHLLE